jgi:hypothetical protein
MARSIYADDPIRQLAYEVSSTGKPSDAWLAKWTAAANGGDPVVAAWAAGLVPRWYMDVLYLRDRAHVTKQPRPICRNIVKDGVEVWDTWIAIEVDGKDVVVGDHWYTPVSSNDDSEEDEEIGPDGLTEGDRRMLDAYKKYVRPPTLAEILISQGGHCYACGMPLRVCMDEKTGKPAKTFHGRPVLTPVDMKHADGCVWATAWAEAIRIKRSQ